MARGHQARLAPRLAFEHDLAEALAVVELHGQQHVVQDVEQVRHLGNGRLAGDEEARCRPLLPAHLREIGRVPHAAGLAVDALRELDVVLAGRAHLLQGAAEEGDVGQQLLRHRAQVEAQVHVQDAVGEEVVIEQRAVGHVADGDGNRLVRAVEVGQLERREARQVLGRVGALLACLERGRVGDDGLNLFRRHGRFGRVELFPLFGCQPVVMRRVRFGHHGQAMRVVEQVGADEATQEAGVFGQAALDHGQRQLVAQRLERVAAVVPILQGAHVEAQPTREGTGVILAQAELNGIERRFDHVRIDAVGRKLFQRFDDQRLDFGRVAAGDPLHGHAEGGLAHVAAQPAADIFAETGVDQGLAQRRGLRADDGIAEHAQRHAQRRVGHFGQRPVDVDHTLARQVGFAVGAKGDAQLPRAGKGRVQRHHRVDRIGVERVQHLRQDAQPLFRIVVAVEEDLRVGGVVVCLVERHELLVGELRDHRRVAAGVQPVGVVREEPLAGRAAQDRVRRRVDALHLVEDDATIGQRCVRRFQLVVPTFLAQVVRRDERVKDRVQVDLDQVVEVLQVGARHRVGRLVGRGEGVEKGVQRPLEQLHEGLLERILLRAAQHRVFQDVGNTGRVGRRRAERDAEDLVLVVVFQREHFGARLRMPVEARPRLQFVDLLVAHQVKAIG